MSGSDWSPQTYRRFEDERTRPARDLLAQVPLASAQKVVDMGCGPGNSTELLVERFPEAEIMGIDPSPAMLAEARQRLPIVRFEQGSAESFLPDADTDLLYANAVYQWVPDHLSVLQRQFAALRSGGVLAVQLPDNFAEPTHRLMREVALAGPWAQRLAHAARPLLPPVANYFAALSPHASRLDIWHTIYNHPLPDAPAIVEWVRSTGLRPFLDPLDEAERAAFLADYTDRIAQAYPPVPDGRVLLRFPRLFIVAQR